MLTLLATIGRVLLARWPALLAWYLGAALVHYYGIIGAAYAGATSAAIGFLLLPLAILAKLIAFVAMFLVVRDALRELQAIAPLPDSSVERRRTFMSTLLASILPFFAIYTAWGFLQEDVDSYAQRALAIRSGLGAPSGRRRDRLPRRGRRPRTERHCVVAVHDRLRLLRSLGIQTVWLDAAEVDEPARGLLRGRLGVLLAVPHQRRLRRPRRVG